MSQAALLPAAGLTRGKGKEGEIRCVLLLMMSIVSIKCVGGEETVWS